MLDSSDGLSTDLGRLVRASGCGATIDALPIHTAASAVATAAGGDPADFALNGGEDFELIVTVDRRAFAHLARRYAARFNRPLLAVGRLEREPGVRLALSEAARELVPAGYDHFTGSHIKLRLSGAESNRAMELLDTASGHGRRQAAPHPGPGILHGYLEPLGLDAASLAAQIGMEASLLGAMLSGEKSIDVETAVRLSRSLQLNPQTLMEMQMRHDFACARSNDRLETIPVLAADGRVRFPEDGFLRGRLAGLRETTGYGEVRFETLGFFADPKPGQDVLVCMYDIRLGARLRIYGPDGRPVWTGVVLETLDGKPLLPYARPNTWIEWFAGRERADFVPAPGTPVPCGC